MNRDEAVEYWELLLDLPNASMTEEMRETAEEHLLDIWTPTPASKSTATRTPTPTKPVTVTVTRTPSPTRTPTPVPRGHRHPPHKTKNATDFSVAFFIIPSRISSDLPHTDTTPADNAS